MAEVVHCGATIANQVEKQQGQAERRWFGSHPRDHVPPLCWKLGRWRLFPGPDGVSRVAVWPPPEAAYGSRSCVFVLYKLLKIKVEMASFQQDGKVLPLKATYNNYLLILYIVLYYFLSIKIYLNTVYYIVYYIFYTFCSSLVKVFPPDLRIRVKRAVFSIVSEVEESIITRDNVLTIPNRSF